MRGDHHDIPMILSPDHDQRMPSYFMVQVSFPAVYIGMISSAGGLRSVNVLRLDVGTSSHVHHI